MKTPTSEKVNANWPHSGQATRMSETSQVPERPRSMQLKVLRTWSRVSGMGFGDWVLEFWGLGFWFKGLGFGVRGLGFVVKG
jgi:hypothetical protein